MKREYHDRTSYPEAYICVETFIGRFRYEYFPRTKAYYYVHTFGPWWMPDYGFNHEIKKWICMWHFYFHQDELVKHALLGNIVARQILHILHT